MAFAMAGTGVISLVYWFEIYYEAGFTAYWWSSMTEPALIVIASSGRKLELASPERAVQQSVLPKATIEIRSHS